ncbi:MAG TPA: pyridoxamine 5'-phosphate oxidase [Solirubrobacterales bacterium]|nr:pyridoxamine 5'-phosphate oxidase [Solirubrobacterales bacterium]HMU26086.1 pyridoxamine 5'-phosphate oxidase [Solirubrobacterales bacterium]HMX71989.1 pyridoxamine 5'-phosphate oxidase [Solirubrobacterales bacterium]HMY26515.1 pyridoxamine 5'-phosphate oxidase [Solirubrobacterales bacterium]HNA43400.1 pyridoxamine 5'-phosphate oxidase [Solirubrobacterales bacterium]
MSFPSPDRQPLARTDLDPDPIKQFGAWFEAAAEIVALPEAMTLATVDEAGRPDARMVLLKGHGADGFRFFTNYEGVKAAQLDASGEAALVFFWAPQDRQVRVRGPVRRLDADASDRYFASRDRASQVGAWASPQSQPIPDQREALEELAEAAADRFAEGEVPRPQHWGGFILEPRSIEFWQGRGARLHDRFRYDRQDSGEGWKITRLAP